MAELAVKVSVAMEFDNVQKKKRKPTRERKASYESLCERLKSAIAKDGGRYVTFGFASGESDPSMERCGLLACGVEYDKKLYFLYVDKNRTVQMVHHSETYRLMREIPSSFSVLSYIYSKQRQTVIDIVQYYLDEHEDDMKLIGEIGIHPVRSEKKNFNRNGKPGTAKRQHHRNKKKSANDAK